MVSLAREFDACGECRLEIGGPLKYRMLTDDEIRTVVLALENMENAELRKELEAVKSELADVRRNVGSYINDQKWLEE